MADAEPLTSGEFRTAILAVLGSGCGGLVVAVSGGPDSMALLHGVAGLARDRSCPAVTVGTVDHGLRAGSDVVAGRVREAATALGLPCRVLAWTGDKPTTGVQAAARTARYRLLLDLCGETGADHLLTAHTADDQAETVLMRLARGSGVAGLAAMRVRRSLGAVTLARPFLGFRKARLLATCQALGLAVDHDPANLDPRFERGRLRALAVAFEAAGLHDAALVRLAERSARADDALAAVSQDAFQRCREPAGLRLGPLVTGPREVLMRALAIGLAEAGAGQLRLSRLERLATQLAQATSEARAVRRTLGGVVLSLDAAGVLSWHPEKARRRGSGEAFALTRDRGRFSRGGVISWQG